MTHNWAPLVFARTYEVDYRLLAIPEDFTLEDMTWATRYILGTFETFVTEDGPNPLRWSVFKDKHHCVVGVTCMTYQLPTDKFQDKVGRRGLQVFLGYVARGNPIKMLPSIENSETLKSQQSSFGSLYQLVGKRWNETRQSNTIDKHRYNQPLPPGMLDYNKTEGWYLNTKSKETWVFGTKENDFLWTIASQEKEHISLCLGLSTKTVAQKGPFLNTTTLDCNKPVGKMEILPKLQAAQASPSTPSVSYSESVSTRQENSSNPVKNLLSGGKALFKEGLNTLGGRIGGPNEDEIQQFDRPVEGNLYQSKYDTFGESGGRREQKQGLPFGFKPKPRGVEEEEMLPDPTATGPSLEQHREVPPASSEKDASVIPSGFKLKQSTAETEETLPDPTATPSVEKSTAVESLPLTSLKDVKHVQEIPEVETTSNDQPTEPLQTDNKPNT